MKFTNKYILCLSLSALSSCLQLSTAASSSTSVSRRTVSAVCVDSPLRIRFFKADGTRVSRSCAWVARRDTVNRCSLDGIAEACPSTCGTCSTCADPSSDLSFRFDDGGTMISKTCDWVASADTVTRCALTGNICRATCDACSPVVAQVCDAPTSESYAFIFGGSVWGSTLGPDDVVPGFYGRYIDGAFMVGLRDINPSNFTNNTPEMQNVNLSSDSKMLLSFDYKRNADPCPDTELYLRLRLITGKFDWFGDVATSELVGPLTTDQQSYSAVFDMNDDIVSKAQDGYTYRIDIVIPGSPTDSICTGTRVGMLYTTLITNFACYEPE